MTYETLNRSIRVGVGCILATTLFLTAGGCPSGSESNGDVPGGLADVDLWDGDSAPPGNDSSPDAGDSGGGGQQNDSGDGTSGDPGQPADPRALSSSAATTSGSDLTVRLVGESPQGTPLTFVIVTPPDRGDLGEVAPVSNTTAEVTYSPTPGYVGAAQFSFRVNDGARDSNVATVSIAVYPDVYFLVAPLEGSAPLQVRAYAATADGGPLPEATYSWSFDGQIEEGPLATHADRTRTFVAGGEHAVRLSLTIAGFSSALIVSHADPSGPAEARAVVLPVIQGVVRDDSGNGLGNIVLSATGNRTATTDANGKYALEVPFDWSGTVAPAAGSWRFEPASRGFTRVKADVSGADFTGSLPPAPPTPNQPPSASDQSVTVAEDATVDVQLGGTDPEGAPLRYIINTVPVWGTITDNGNGHTVTVGDLPYTLAGNGAVVAYTGNRNYFGSDAFTFRVHDGTDASSNATVSVSVTAVAEPPVLTPASPPPMVVEKDSTGSEPANLLSLAATDPDGDSSRLAWAIAGQPQGDVKFINGTKSHQGPSATIRYIPAAGYTGIDLFDLQVTDEVGELTQLSITVIVGGYPISGVVADRSGAGLAGVPVVARLPDGSEFLRASSDSAGTYFLQVPPGWTGTVSSDADYRFDPPSRAYSNVQTPALNDGYTAFRNYYASISGNDSAAGKFASPFRTIKKAAGLAKPGDTIYLRGGVFTESYVRFAHSGEPGYPISVEGYGNEEVRLTTGSSAQWFFDFTDEQGSAATHGFGHYNFRKFKCNDSRHIWRFSFPGQGGGVKNHHILLEDITGWNCASVLSARRSGVAFLTIRRCDFSQCTGTEGSLDFSNNMDDVDLPQGGSHDILIEDTNLHDNNASQQCNGMVTQGSVYNVTLRGVKSWNNGKYGLALKGSGNMRVDRCVVWGNGSSALYMRGMVATDPTVRTANAYNDHLVTNSVIIGPQDGGGGTVIWRENTNVRVFNCTVIACRDEDMINNGWPLAIGERAIPPDLAVTGEFRNCLFITNDGAAAWFYQSSNKFWQMRKYMADHNMFYRLGGGSTTAFKYQGQNWTSISQWKAYWAVGEPGGDDLLNGPTATNADANSTWADPLFVDVQPGLTPLAKFWSADPALDHADFRVRVGSPALGAGENLSSLNIPELSTDLYGNPRPASGAWSIGAVEVGATQ